MAEETGIVVVEADLQPLTAFYPLHSMSAEKVTVYMVQIEPTEVNTAGTEYGELIADQQFFSFHEVYKMIENGQINDVATGHVVQLAMRKCGL